MRMPVVTVIACETRTRMHTTELVSCRFSRSLTRCEECACRKGTNSQVSADDGRPAVRGVVAKSDRETNGSCFKTLLGKIVIKNADSIFVKAIDISVKFFCILTKLMATIL
jgi:hypothetical protein